MSIVVVGLSHKTAPVEVREKLSIPEAKIEGAIADLLNYPNIEEVAIISTCNRLEIYVIAKETEQGVQEVNLFLSEVAQLPLRQLRRHLFTLLHHDAVMHLMRVAAGLESLVLGEGQILAQVKTAHKQGQKYQGLGRLLDKLFKQAISAGKRVRSETNIGTGAVSISSAAVELALIKLQSFSNCRVAIIGAGKMSRLLVKHLLAKGATEICIANRSQKRAQELANKFPEATLQICGLPEMMGAIATADLVFTSTAATEPILNRAKLEPVIEATRSLMLCDISVPLNVHGDVKELTHIQSYN
ncbi:MAG: glutamyl-tRNA reductase, partial [Spirulinaceae cyanobacterium]